MPPKAMLSRVSRGRKSAAALSLGVSGIHCPGGYAQGYNPLKSGARHEAIYADPTTQNVIPAEGGIQGCKLPSLALAPRFRGGDAQLLKFPTLFGVRHSEMVSASSRRP